MCLACRARATRAEVHAVNEHSGPVGLAPPAVASRAADEKLSWALTLDDLAAADADNTRENPEGRDANALVVGALGGASESFCTVRISHARGASADDGMVTLRRPPTMRVPSNADDHKAQQTANERHVCRLLHDALTSLGTAVPRRRAERVGGDPAREYAFTKCDNSAFGAGVLYALGTAMGTRAYSNPAGSGAVRLTWSDGAANYYSTRDGHKYGDSTQASRIICANIHPGDGATGWSRGAWFAIDLLSVEVRLSHFAYRNDFSGGGNHLRTFELQGSNDGRTWTTLSAHNGESWSANSSAKHWPVGDCRPIGDEGGDGGEYFRMLRILNKGSPSLLCCSGIEFYGHVRPAAADGATVLQGRLWQREQLMVSVASLGDDHAYGMLARLKHGHAFWRAKATHLNSMMMNALEDDSARHHVLRNELSSVDRELAHVDKLRVQVIGERDALSTELAAARADAAREKAYYEAELADLRASSARERARLESDCARTERARIELARYVSELTAEVSQLEGQLRASVALCAEEATTNTKLTSEVSRLEALIGESEKRRQRVVADRDGLLSDATKMRIEQALVTTELHYADGETAALHTRLEKELAHEVIEDNTDAQDRARARWERGLLASLAYAVEDEMFVVKSEDRAARQCLTAEVEAYDDELHKRTTGPATLLVRDLQVFGVPNADAQLPDPCLVFTLLDAPPGKPPIARTKDMRNSINPNWDGPYMLALPDGSKAAKTRRPLIRVQLKDCA